MLLALPSHRSRPLPRATSISIKVINTSGKREIAALNFKIVGERLLTSPSLSHKQFAHDGLHLGMQRHCI